MSGAIGVGHFKKKKKQNPLYFFQILNVFYKLFLYVCPKIFFHIFSHFFTISGFTHPKTASHFNERAENWYVYVTRSIAGFQMSEFQELMSFVILGYSIFMTLVFFMMIGYIHEPQGWRLGSFAYTKLQE